MNFTKSEQLFSQAKELIPGGVNSPVRAFGSIGMAPPFIKSAKGSTITDVDGNTYIDYVGSWGPMVLGHAREEIVEAVRRAAERSTSFGAPCEDEVVLARMVTEAVPSVEMVRMVNSGTEAVMSAIRVARGFTGRNKIIKFEGCYHGHSDCLLVQAGSGAMTFGVPDSPGVPADVTKHTLTAPYNDMAAVEALFDAYGDDIACVVVEPVAGNMGLVPPAPGFLEFLRSVTERHGALLIFDEVMTGFRLAYNGAQGRFGIKPDLTTFGKIIGGGLPVGAYGGRRDVMSWVSPSGPVYQAGTLSGNPLAMAAGVAALTILRDNPGIYDDLERKAALLEDGYRSLHAPITVNRVGAMLSVFFTEKPVTNLASAKESDTARFASYFKKMLRQGIYLPPSQFEALFLSVCHTEEQIAKTVECAKIAIEL